MDIEKEPSGRRSVQIEIELPGTPEEVWQAIATGPGISSWFVPTEFEMREDKPVSLILKFGPGMEPRSAVTTWDPPHLFATRADGWMPGAPAIANEWHIEARAGGTCTLRIVQSLFASTADWDDQLQGAKSGLASFLSILRIYLTHFRGQGSTTMKWIAPAAGTEAEAWEALTAPLGLNGMRVGERRTTPEGVPALRGVVEYATQNPFDALLRLDKPGPGVAALGAFSMGGPTMVALNFYLYGDQGAAIVARESSQWDVWFQKRFPMRASPEEYR